MRVVLLIWTLCFLANPHDSAGQSPSLEPTSALFENRMEQGVELLDHERHAEAVEVLRSVHESDAAYFSRTHGSIAFWLGAALEQSGRPDAAGDVLQSGMHAMTKAGRFDVGLAEKFVRMTFQHRRRDHYEAAAHAYLEMLRIAIAAGHPEACARIRDQLQALSWIVTPEVAAGLGLNDALSEEPTCESVDGVGITGWWRSQDPYPLTDENERLYEHLERASYALDQYQPDGEFDDRARIYVRLGAPSKQIDIGFSSPEFQNKVIFRQMTLHAFDFPENEFWIYPHIDRSAQYLFVSDLGHYRLAETSDLIPSQLRQGLGVTERGIRKSEALIRTLEEIFRELSVLHDTYAMLYVDVADFGELLDQQDIASQAALPHSQVDHFGSDRPPVRTDMLPALPHVFASGIVNRVRTEEAIARKAREEVVPAAYSGLMRSYGPLDVHVRTARFLGSDGSTRTDVYWAVSSDALTPSRVEREALDSHNMQPPWTYMVFVLARHYGGDYRTRDLQYERLVLPVSDSEPLIGPRTISVEGGHDTYHLAIQWDEYVTSQKDTLLQDAGGPRRLKVHVHREDTLQALAADGSILEMSDVKPVLRPASGDDGDAGIEEVLSGEAPPYPYESVTTDTRLALYFEAYHLNFGPDDRTHYDVEYEVTRTRDSPMLRLLGGERRGSTSALTTQRGSSRTAREAILLDLSEWEGRGDLQITVRVTDRTTGRSVERSLSFTLAP